MTFRLLIEQVRKLISSAARDAGYPVIDFDVSEPPRNEFGDLTCNIAFHLSKQAKKAPSKIAEDLIDRIKPNISQDSFVQSAEPHPAGYINFKANYAKLSTATLTKVLQEPDKYGHYDYGKGQHVIIEHTSVNPNKALHVGHIRNVILGDTLYRIMKITNHRTTVLNYVDNSGLQVADIVVGFRFAGMPVEPPDNKKFDQYCGDEVYVKINAMYEKDPALAEKRRLVLREIEEGKSEIANFAREITLRVLREQLKTCWRMKTRYDLLNFESQIIISKLWSKAFELLKKNNFAKYETQGKNKGCWVIEAKGEEDKVIVRSDGTTTYIAKDIPYAAWKLGLVDDPFSYLEFVRQWDSSTLYATDLGINNYHKSANFKFRGGERVITIVDSRQARLQRIISQVLSQLSAEAKEYFHLSYEAVTLSSSTAKTMGIDIGERESSHMSGRKGIYVNADYVLDALQAKAYEEVKVRNPEFDEEHMKVIAEEIAISAIRYNMIKQDLDKMITFDLKESMSLEGDTGPYLQYAYARSRRILEKSGQMVNKEGAKLELLTHISEIAVIHEIAKLDLVIEEAAKSLSPKSIARYAYSLATIFNLFYEKVPVLKEQNVDIRMARLILVNAFGITLKNALALLGITALERM